MTGQVVGTLTILGILAVGSTGGCRTTDTDAIPQGDAAVERGDLEQAESDFSAAIERKQDFAHAFWKRAEARQRLGRDQEAKLDRNRAIELDPSLGFADSDVGNSLLKAFSGKDHAIEVSPLDAPALKGAAKP